MTLAVSLSDFMKSVVQCENLIANSHKVDGAGLSVLPEIDRQQITVAAFLNMHIAWEMFLESSLVKLMTGEATVNGGLPTRYVTPLDAENAQKIIIGMMRYFDYANHHNMRKIASIYFDQGYPYEPHLGAVFSDLEDLRTMRNSSAHISSTTQSALEALATRIFGTPQPGITLYRLLTSADPRSPPKTVFVTYKDKLWAAASLIANG
ncbi:MAG: hypothetical protein ACT4SY_03050 [Hyphomicrobiales bacterium]